MSAQKSRILFVVPPYYCFRDLTLDPPMATLGVLYLAAFAREHGHDVQVTIADIADDIEPRLYLTMEQYTREWPNYARCIRGERDHRAWNTITEAVDRINPDIIAISANSPVIDSAFRVAHVVKRQRPDVPVVLGGFHGTFEPDHALADPNIDYVIRGEGELPLISLLERLDDGANDLSSVPGLSYRTGEGNTHNQAGPQIKDLDALPFPARDSVILPEGIVITTQAILAARGCPHACSFCADRAFWRKLRTRSVENVLDEIEVILQQFPATDELFFHDGTLTCNRSYLIDLCDGIMSRGFRLSLAGTARFDELDADLLAAMKRAGFQSLYLGAESGSADVLAKMNKKITPEEIQRGLQLVHDAGLQSLVAILVGTPAETEESLKQTIELMKRVRPTAFDVNSYLPLPGSRYYEEMPPDVRESVNYLDFAYADCPATPGLSPPHFAPRMLLHLGKSGPTAH